MAGTFDIPAWIILFVGLYSLAAAIGEWRKPGTFAAMLEDFERLPGLRFITGFLVLALGAAVYLVNPWRPGDWLAILVSLLGGVMTIEGLVILAMGDRFLPAADWLIGHASTTWAALSMLLGLAFITLALIRLDIF